MAEVVADAFDGVADRYERAVEESIAFARVGHDFFVKQKADVLLEVARSIGSPAGLRVLDVGCGTGTFDRYLVDEVAELHGVDVSQPMVALAARENARCSYRVYDGKTLPYDDRSLDVAFAVCVFHHVTRANRLRLAAEMARVLRTGGISAIFEHNPWNPLTRLAVNRCEFDKGVELMRLHESAQLLRDAGLVRLRSRFLIFLPRPTPHLDRWLAHVPVGAQYAVFARKP
jgi:ubiquinone/menaquinone biosynthesis C-methylase UbiE